MPNYMIARANLLDGPIATVRSCGADEAIADI